MSAKACMQSYPGFGAGWFSFTSLYKGPCANFNGCVLLSDVPESFKVLFCFSDVVESLKVNLLYRAFLLDIFCRVYFDLGAMQYQNRDWARPGAV